METYWIMILSIKGFLADWRLGERGFMLTTMLVEDNASFREIVRDQLLSRFSSMNVIGASNGEEAFKGLASYPVDLTFMDIGLPGQNGLELTRKVKSNNQDNVVVMLSGYDSD